MTELFDWLDGRRGKQVWLALDGVTVASAGIIVSLTQDWVVLYDDNGKVNHMVRLNNVVETLEKLS